MKLASWADGIGPVFVLVRDILSRSTEPEVTLGKLAQNPRYAGLVASEFGRSLLIGRVDDSQV